MNKFYVRTFSFFFCLSISVGSLLAQTDAVTIVKPILLDKEALSGIGLQKIDLKDDPDRDFFQRRLYAGEDLSIYIVSSESWKTSFDNFSFDELVYILNGEAKVKPEGGKEQTFHSHEFFSIPKGYKGSWEVLAGDNYHYELSVIATKRTPLDDTVRINSPRLLDKSKISGIDIIRKEKGKYEEVLSKGVELTVYIRSEYPNISDIVELESDQLFYILSGQVEIEDLVETKHAFYTGDFFILPKNFKGKWKSRGHGLFKTIVVEKTDEI